MAKYTNPYSRPSIEGTDANELTDKIKDTAQAEATANKEKAQAGSESVVNEGMAYDKNKLDSNHNNNVAKGQSQYGMYNNKDYATTLRLAREADAYNQMPREQLMSIGTRNTGGIKNLGYGYEKPELQTMETRAMNQALGLDTAQKQLAQQLQAAVNANDFEMFKQLVTQKLGLELSDYEMQNLFNQYTRSLQLQNIVTKDLTEFKDEWSRHFNMASATTVYNMLLEDENWAVYASDILLGVPSPTQMEAWSSAYTAQKLKEVPANATDDDVLRTLYKAGQELVAMGIDNAVVEKQMQKIRDSGITNLRVWANQVGDYGKNEFTDNKGGK